MEFMSAQQSEILGKLLQLAHGNASLVQQAILESSRQGRRVPRLREVVDTIRSNVDANPPHPA